MATLLSYPPRGNVMCGEPMGANYKVKCTDSKLMVTEKREPDTDP